MHLRIKFNCVRLALLNTTFQDVASSENGPFHSVVLLPGMILDYLHETNDIKLFKKQLKIHYFSLTFYFILSIYLVSHAWTIFVRRAL